MQKSEVSPCNTATLGNLNSSIRTPSTRISRMPETEKLLQREITERVKVEDKLGMVFEELKSLKSNANYQELTIEQMKTQSEQLKRNYEVEIEILRTASHEKDDIIQEIEDENNEILNNLETLEKAQMEAETNLEILEKEISQLENTHELLNAEQKEKQIMIEKLNLDLQQQQKNTEKILHEKQKLEDLIEDKKSKFGESETDLSTKLQDLKKKSRLSKMFGVCLLAIFGASLAVQIQ
ncbi:hypothetical protein SS50377_27471 [Spironucleus salmonicida]|uniref:Uncharacterized protein n=1 Tax=Spironucleus salmonicida TaxID=348837 RepID=V6LQS6_9EUKA|nr:hypothetical protein SS50377_27471 [Spironucleus salmonicida]|eukprot:EST46935.1 Hypothetical protein SS50377_13092 [Spironucleus salmonicida]